MVAGEPDLLRRTAIQSFSVAAAGAKAIDLASTNDTSILSGLDQAKKNLTLFKPPSTDDLLAGLFQSKVKFGLNFDVSVTYSGKSWIQIVHFFGEDATLSSQPTRQGKGKTLLLKMEFSFPKARFKHNNSKIDGKWVPDDEWIQ